MNSFANTNCYFQIGNYLALFNRKTGVTLARCDRYVMEGCVGVALIATRNWYSFIIHAHSFYCYVQEKRTDS